MADKKISDLTDLTSVASDDTLAVVDASTATTKEATVANIAAAIPASTITTAMIAGDAVTPDKMDFGAQTAEETGTGTTTSTSYTATLSGSPGTNPSVSVTVPASGCVLVCFSAQVHNDTAGSRLSVSYAVSGANTVAATDSKNLHFRSGTAAQAAEFGVTHLLTGLTPGSTTFTLQYRVNANTGTFLNRKLTVIPIGD